MAAFERLVHKSHPSETVGDDTKTGVTVLGMEDMRVKAHLIQNSARIASWTQRHPRDHENTDGNPVPMQIGAHPKRKGKGKDSRDAKGRSNGKDTKNESSKKMTADDLRR